MDLPKNENLFKHGLNEFVFYPFWNLGFSFSSFGSNLVKPNELIVGFSTLTSLVNYGVELAVPSGYSQAPAAFGKICMNYKNDGMGNGLSHGFVGIFARQWSTDSAAKVCQKMTSAMNCYVRSPEQIFDFEQMRTCISLISSPKKIERCIPLTRQ